MTDASPSPAEETRLAGPERFDVLRYPEGTHRAVPAGDGATIVAAHEAEARRRRLFGVVAAAVVPPVLGLVVGAAYSVDLLPAAVVGIAVGVVAAAVRYTRDRNGLVPEVVVADAPTRVVRDYVDEFDPEDVSSPFE